MSILLLNPSPTERYDSPSRVTPSLPPQRIKQQQQQQQQQQQNNKHTNKLSGFPEFSYNHSYSLAAESGTVRIVSYPRKQHNCLVSVRA